VDRDLRSACGDAEMNTNVKAKRPPEFDPVVVRDISERVYRERLEAESGDGAVDRMILKDGDSGAKLRERAACYDSLTRSFLRAMKEGF